jgi:hypothetical protein
MGDITGRPKAPSQKVVYVPQYVYDTPSSGTGGNTNSGNNGIENTPETPTPAEQREKNLLSRSRSRIGTILTGFRGILAPNDTDSQRKTLLGE